MQNRESPRLCSCGHNLYPRSNAVVPAFTYIFLPSYNFCNFLKLKRILCTLLLFTKIKNIGHHARLKENSIKMRWFTVQTKDAIELLNLCLFTTLYLLCRMTIKPLVTKRRFPPSEAIQRLKELLLRFVQQNFEKYPEKPLSQFSCILVFFLLH